MDFKLVWTPLAREDLQQVVCYIARDNPQAARQVGEGILKAVEVLERMPQFGRVVPERQDPSIREVIRVNYRIVYRVREETRSIQIWRVWHGASGTPQLGRGG